MVRGGHLAWRYTLLSGLIPALPLLVVRPFLPESPLWREKKASIRFERPHLSELFQPTLLRTTLVATLLLACTYALALGAIQHTVRMVPGLSDMHNLPPRQVEQISSGVQMFQELGGMSGRILFAVFVAHIVSQRRRALLFFVPSLIVFPFLYFFCGDAYFSATPSWNFPCHDAFQRTPQLLGKLFAEGLSHPSAKHWRKFRRQHRWQSDRRLRGSDDDYAVQRHAGSWSRRTTRPLRRHSRNLVFGPGIDRHLLVTRACGRSSP
jgi:hypothetical protein